jgi:hypothetical protein
MKLGMTLGAALLALATGCPGPGHGAVQGDNPAPTAADAIAKLASARDALHGFTAESVMDYWLGDQRVKGTVLVMGELGAKVRFAALSPAGGSTLAEMACNGADFAYVDTQKNCAMVGPCSRDSIARFLRVPLDPDDFLHLALGTPPVLDGATGTITWDASKGTEQLALTAPGGTEKLTIDARDHHWDVISAELAGADGKQVWSVENTDFGDVNDAAGVAHRLPGKSRLKAPGEKADLLVEWHERTLNPTIAPEKFVLTPPAGLPSCQ